MSNPYEPPAFEEPAPPPPGKASVRPTAVTVFGILNIIFASIGLLCLPFNLLIPFLPQPANGPKNPFLSPFQENPDYTNFIVVMSVIGLVAAVVELASGIGLLRMKPWGRTLAIAYGLYGILAAVAQVAGSYAFLISPTLEKARQLNDQQAGVQATAQGVGAVAGAAFGVLYPILLLIFMTRPNVVRALSPGKPADAETMDAF